MMQVLARCCDLQPPCSCSWQLPIAWRGPKKHISSLGDGAAATPTPYSSLPDPQQPPCQFSIQQPTLRSAASLSAFYAAAYPALSSLPVSLLYSSLPGT